MMFEIQDLTPDRDLRVAIVAARFNRFIVDELLAGARDALVLPVTHTGMLFSREVAEQTAYFLVHGRFRHGAAGGAQSSSSSLSA